MSAEEQKFTFLEHVVLPECSRRCWRGQGQGGGATTCPRCQGLGVNHLRVTIEDDTDHIMSYPAESGNTTVLVAGENHQLYRCRFSRFESQYFEEDGCVLFNLYPYTTETRPRNEAAGWRIHARYASRRDRREARERSGNDSRETFLAGVFLPSCGCASGMEIQRVQTIGGETFTRDVPCSHCDGLGFQGLDVILTRDSARRIIVRQQDGIRLEVFVRPEANSSQELVFENIVFRCRIDEMYPDENAALYRMRLTLYRMRLTPLPEPEIIEIGNVATEHVETESRISSLQESAREFNDWLSTQREMNRRVPNLLESFSEIRRGVREVTEIPNPKPSSARPAKPVGTVSLARFRGLFRAHGDKEKKW